MRIKTHRKDGGLTLFGLLVAIAIIALIVVGVIVVYVKIKKTLDKLFPKGYDPEQAYQMIVTPTPEQAQVTKQLPIPAPGPPGTMAAPERFAYRFQFSPYVNGPWLPAWDEPYTTTPSDMRHILEALRDISLEHNPDFPQMFFRAVICD